jgi:hypothetical protein
MHILPPGLKAYHASRHRPAYQRAAAGCAAA